MMGAILKTWAPVMLAAVAVGCCHTPPYKAAIINSHAPAGAPQAPPLNSSRAIQVPMAPVTRPAVAVPVAPPPTAIGVAPAPVATGPAPLAPPPPPQQYLSPTAAPPPATAGYQLYPPTAQAPAAAVPATGPAPAPAAQGYPPAGYQAPAAGYQGYPPAPAAAPVPNGANYQQPGANYAAPPSANAPAPSGSNYLAPNGSNQPAPNGSNYPSPPNANDVAPRNPNGQAYVPATPNGSVANYPRVLSNVSAASAPLPAAEPARLGGAYYPPRELRQVIPAAPSRTLDLPPPGVAPSRGASADDQSWPGRARWR